MNLRVNGETRNVDDGLTLDALVKELDLQQRPIAVELNREVVPKDRYVATRLADGDRLEIVSLVGGG